MKRKLVYLMLSMVMMLMTGCGASEKEAVEVTTVTEKEETEVTAVAESEVQEDVEPLPKIFSFDEVTVPQQQVAYVGIETGYNEDGSVRYIETVEYDAIGNELSYMKKDETGAFVQHYTCTYDADGNLIYFITYDELGEEDTTQKFQYNENGQEQINRWSFWGEKCEYVTWTESEYDEEGKLIKKSYYDGEGILESWQEYIYDGAGNLLKVEEYSSEGELGAQTEYEYDSAGNKIAMLENNDFYEDLRTEYQYDAAGNVIYEKQTEKNLGLFYEHEYQFDEAGNNIYAISYNEDGNVKNTYEMEYDEAGRKTKSVTYDVDGNIKFRCEVEYVENP